MKVRIPINLAVEDLLSEIVLRRVLNERSVVYDVGYVYGLRGFGYLRKKTPSFNNAAKACPFLLLTDLDKGDCAPTLLAEWLGRGRDVHPNFVFRVAVREVESWLLADETSLAMSFGIKQMSLPQEPEDLPDPKLTLLKLATQARRDIREAVVWQDDESGRLMQGPDYNGALATHVRDAWGVRKSAARCPSLSGLFRALERLERNYRKG